MSKRIAIVGGSCVDIFATSTLPLIAHDSNPGNVNIGYGGVGRNIAENLARLGQDVTLLAAFGDDLFSGQMLRHTADTGVRTEHAVLSGDMQTPYYISVNDSNGEMAVAVNDMQICNLITPDYLRGKLALLNSCDAVIVDTNIPAESIRFLALQCTVPLFAEAVSTQKAMKLSPVLPHLDAVKANLQEAGALLGATVTATLPSLAAAADRFHALGISSVFITLGKTGAFLSCNHIQQSLPSYPVQTVNTNGCGDAFCAAAFLGVLRHDPPVLILKRALAAAALTARSPQSVSQSLTMVAIDTLTNEMER